MHTANWDVTFVRIQTPFVAETSGEVKRYVWPFLARTGHVVLDLRGATLDSTGLGAVLGMQRHLELHERRLLVVANDPQFLSLVERAGVMHALSLFSDAEQAVQFAGQNFTAA